MKYSIWKYEVEPDLINQEYQMPAGAVILSFGLDDKGKMCFWARVNTEAAMEAHVVACVGTGWPLDTIFTNRQGEYVCFIGTVTKDDYVWHLWDLGVGSVEGRKKEL